MNIPPLDKITTAIDVPCVRSGCKANPKARCMSPEGVPSPRAHSCRQYLYAYITLGEMPDKPNSVTAEEKRKVDEAARKYLGEITVHPNQQNDDDATGDDVVATGPAETTDSAVTSDLQDFVNAIQGDQVSDIMQVADPAQMLVALLQVQGKEAPQEVLDFLGENRLAVIEIMNDLNELEILDLQLDSLRRLHADKIDQLRSKTLLLIKADEATVG